MASTVALVRGTERSGAICRALDLIADEVRPGERVVVTPNFVSTTRPLAATHVDAVRAVLAFLRDRGAGKILVADGASFSDTMEGFRNFGYLPLRDEFGIELVDLNRDAWVEVEAFDRRLQPVRLRLSRTLAESDYVVSVGPPKTHDTVVATLSLKNVIMGGLIRDQKEGGGSAIPAPLGRLAALGLGTLIPSFVRDWPPLQSVRDWVNRRAIHSDKLAMHQGYPVINLNLYRLARVVRPHLSVIDGTVGMEGNRPIAGTPIELGAVVAGTDFLAADTVAAHLMGFPIEEIGYLHYCRLAGMGAGSLSEIEIRGDDVEACVRPFQPHETYQKQLAWRDERLRDLAPAGAYP